MSELYPWLVPTYHKISQTFSEGLGHHALLIKADQGLGAEDLFEALTKHIMCQTPDNAPCDHCHACHLMTAHSHPDFHVLASQEGKDIGVDQVRAINEVVSQHAQQNGNKLVYIREAERLTEAAANALLKTLEEPRPNTYFLLQAEPSSSLLATIYSRCQVWNVPLPTEAEALTWLSSQFQAETSELLTALAMNLGRPLLALDTLQQGLIEQRKNFLRQFWLFYRRRSPLEILPFFEKERIVQQVDWILAFLSDAIKYKLEIQSGWQTLDLKTGVTQFADEQTALGLLTANKIMQKVRSDLLTINGVNTELMLLDGLTKLITDVFKD
ncbi:DNA polymerase III subunit delta' [uncultured Haemophilus sp.]|uniref:DNA polymerase III subunit delta' n=1 Tax=uncultured Haemophilus sp. TaxID=237779 RepID=UPI00261AAE82|nr:DNA polymerase III subunit delta' [uncultured Haemophilus sp.]